MIYFVVASVVLLVIGILLGKATHEELGAVLISLAIFVLIISILAWFGNYTCTKSSIEEFKACKKTIEYQRTNEVEYERATLTIKIIEWNEWLASKQYWNRTIFNDCMPDELMELEQIK